MRKTMKNESQIDDIRKAINALKADIAQTIDLLMTYKEQLDKIKRRIDHLDDN